MSVTPITNTSKLKRFNPQKLFGALGSRIKKLLPLLSGIKVKVRKGERCKPKKNSGVDHFMQFFAAEMCGHKSVYRMDKAKTPKTLRKMGVKFLPKSTHYDNVENLDVESIWQVNSQFLQLTQALPEYIPIMLDETPDKLKGKQYEAVRDGYIGRKKGKPVTGPCHQIFSTALVGQKQFVYAPRFPGNYVAFTNPKEHGDTKLCGLNFDKTVAEHVVRKTHKYLPKKRFLLLFDRGFDKHEFWEWLKEQKDDFVTALDSNAECIKKEQRLIDDGAVVLKKAKGFEYHETIVEVEGMVLKAVYVKPHNKPKPYWLLTTRHDLTGVEIKKEYNKRSGEEPIYDYLKNDFNVKKPNKKSFAGAQSYTAMKCFVQNVISWLSQEIFGAYHRVTTITAFLLEQLALNLLFLSAPKTNKFRKPPPNQCLIGIRMQKNTK